MLSMAALYVVAFRCASRPGDLVRSAGCAPLSAHCVRKHPDSTVALREMKDWDDIK